MKYNEILRLKAMMEIDGIPFEFTEFHNGYHLSYPQFGKNVVCSVIEHDSSFGRYEDLLEIRGLMTDKELEVEDGDVLGYLTAEDVFNRIHEHWVLNGGKK
jgi:hypothetical protein